MRLHASRRLHFRFDDGPDVILLPDISMDVPAATAQQLLALAPDHLQVLPEDDVPLPCRDHDASSPLKAGWFITFEWQGVLSGGPGGGDVGRIWKCVRDGNRRLRVFTHGGFAVEEVAIKGVTEVDEAGRTKGAWLVSAHGLDGQRMQHDVLPPPSVSYVPDLNVCYSCGGRRFWISVAGATICAACHPPVDSSLIAAWTDGPERGVSDVMDCRRREFRDLTQVQRQEMQVAFHLSDAEFTALTTGIWNDPTWNAFWQRDRE